MLLHTNWMNGILRFIPGRTATARGARPHRASWQHGASYPSERQRSLDAERQRLALIQQLTFNGDSIDLYRSCCFNFKGIEGYIVFDSWVIDVHLSESAK